MANYRNLIPIILNLEGGFSNNSSDSGGATMKGVTLSTYKDFCRMKGKPEPTVRELRNISDKEWEEIFKLLYWDKWQADKINNQSIANFLVDWLWNSGKYGIVIPQKVLNVTQDGVVGKVTLWAINSSNQRHLFSLLKAARLEYVRELVNKNQSQQKFLKGWENRINSFSYF